ncbi:response regulator [Mucilaginibacter sp. KACC 22773]|uniref:response regulator n=1 Tax=Mucilaginibacter sp. KACC 22773 TaxID=3025671 RepID=UPI002366F2A9|nr:response regulator [Mucilaginibacter sp. KACC 22773]WDF79578.1 response regulator [Mucilaginibacter sp. KACC 22773]
METIMVQEADAATLDVVATALQMEGYRVCSLDDTNENALEMIRRHHPKLVLLDCWLSHNSAGQVSQWIKAHFPHLPVIAFSCDNQIEAKYRQFGFDDYIQKPFELHKLYQVIRKYLPQRHKRRETTDHA